jgi:hypothetical protein
VILTVLTNGRRDCIAQAIPAALNRLDAPFTDYAIIDDSGDPAYRAWLGARFPLFHIEPVADAAAGFPAAMRHLWRFIAAHTTEDETVFHLEDDFVVQQYVDLTELEDVLNRHDLMQLALKRQPWFGNEVEHGGVIEAIEANGPATFTEVSDDDGRCWIEHREHFTCNPSLFPAWVARLEWPDQAWSEATFGANAFAALPGVRCGYWGSRDDEPLVEHIGHHRAGFGY